jgi:hypothetical protein
MSPQRKNSVGSEVLRTDFVQEVEVCTSEIWPARSVGVGKAFCVQGRDLRKMQRKNMKRLLKDRK